MKKSTIFLIVLLLNLFTLINISLAADYTFTVNEGEHIKILPKVYDPDNDSITIQYSYPLNSSGEWIPSYEDQGAYLTTITISDGKSTIRKTVKIIVKNVDRPPVIKVKNHYSVEENQTLTFGITSYDPDNDNVTLSILNIPKNARFENGFFTFTPSYDFVNKTLLYKILQAMPLRVRAKRTFSLTIIAKSNNLSVNKTVKITVIDKNRPPIINSTIKPVVAKELDTIVIKPQAYDPDNDFLFYKVKGWIDSKKYKTKIGDIGKHQVEVIVTDGEFERKYIQDIIIKRTNIAPEILNLPKDIIVKEGEKKIIKLHLYDKNNDKVWLEHKLPYFAKIEDENLIIDPPYNLSNRTFEYKTKATINITDGNLKNSYNITIIVKNVNRKPVITNYSPEIYTKQEILKPIVFKVNVTDFDNDKLYYIWYLPNFVKIKTDKNILKFIPTSLGTKKIKVKVCDYNSCTEKTWTLNVYKVVKIK